MKQEPMQEDEMQNTPQRDPESIAVLWLNSTTIPKKDTKMAKVHMDAWGLPHFPGPSWSPFMDYRPHLPPPSCWPHGPHQPPRPSPFGLLSDDEAGRVPIRNNGTLPNKDPEMGKVSMDVRGLPHCPRLPSMPYHMEPPLSGFTGYGLPEPSPHL